MHINNKIQNYRKTIWNAFFAPVLWQGIISSVKALDCLPFKSIWYIENEIFCYWTLGKTVFHSHLAHNTLQYISFCFRNNFTECQSASFLEKTIRCNNVQVLISETFTSHLKKLKFSLFSGNFSEVKNEFAILSFLTTAWRRSVKLIETSILNILNLGKDPGKQWKILMCKLFVWLWCLGR